MKSLLFLCSVFLAASVAAACGSDGGSEINDCGWQPIKDPSDGHLTVVALFAVAEYNKNFPTAIYLTNVFSGDYQIVSDVSGVSSVYYRLVLVVSVGVYDAFSRDYEATVWEKSLGNFELKAFRWIKD